MPLCKRDGRRAPARGRSHALSEWLEERTFLTAVFIGGSSSSDSITVSWHAVASATFIDYTVNGNFHSVAIGPGDTVLVDTGLGQDTVNILNTVVPTTVTGHASAGADDTLNVGDNSGVQNCHGLLHLENSGTGFWNVNINNIPDTSAHTETLGSVSIGGASFGQITGMAPATFEYRYADVDHVVIDTGKGSNTINVHAVGSKIDGYTWLLANAASHVNVGDSGSLQNIRGTLYVSAAPSSCALDIDDSADTFSSVVTMDTTSFAPAPTSDTFERIQGLAPFPIAWEWDGMGAPVAIHAGTLGSQFTIGTLRPPGAPKSVDLFTTALDDTTIVQEVGSAATLNVHGRNGSDRVIVPAGYVPSILGTLSVDNQNGLTRLFVDDSQESSPRTVTLDTFTNNSNPNWEGIVGLSLGTIQYSGDSTAATIIGGSGGNVFNVRHTPASGNTLTLNPGSGNHEVVNVQATAANSTLLIDGHGAGDFVNIGVAGSMQQIAGAVNIQNVPSFTTVTADDSADPFARHVTLDTFVDGTDTWQSITGLAPGVISYDGQGTLAATISGGPAGNTFTVLHAAALTPVPFVGALTLNTGSGADTVNVQSTDATSTLHVNGQDGADSITLDFTGGDINGTIAVDGGAGTDALTLKGTGPGDAYNVTAAGIAHGANTAAYANLENLVLGPGQFTVTEDLAGMFVHAATSGTTVSFTVTQHLSFLGINGTLVTLAPSATPNGKTLFCTGLALGSTGKLDLNDNQLQYDYGTGVDPVATVRGWLASGYKGGAWNGDGIITSAADGRHGLAIADSADGAVAGLPPHTLLLKFARYGDVNLDGTVAFAGLLALAQHYGQTNANWDQGDMNYDGTVNFADLLALAQNYGGAAPAVSAAAFASVGNIAPNPEPRRRK